MYFVYILYSKKVRKLYIGFTRNLSKRIKAHNEGKSSATKNWLSLILIYAELYRNKKDALRRERFFKTGWGRRYVRKILEQTLKELSGSKI